MKESSTRTKSVSFSAWSAEVNAMNFEKFLIPDARVLPYENVLREVRDHMAKNYAHLFVSLIGDDRAGEKIMKVIAKYICDNGIRAEEVDDPEELVKRLYNDYSKYGVITEYVGDKNVEEINCNSYEDIEIVRQNGFEKLSAGYAAPQQMQDYAKKIMSIGGITLDEANPTGDGFIGTGIRASAIRYPCVDETVGAVLSIRRQRMAGITRRQLIAGGTAIDEELDLLSDLLRYGVSVVFGGAVGSGKTTDMNYFLRQLPNESRIFVIEDTRELDLIKRNAEGKVLNRVIHTRTRYSDNKTKNIDMNALLRMGLRFSPDFIVPSEMRGAEAMTAQEAARTGHTVVTSLHTNSAEAAYRRILTMCNMAGGNIRDNLLLDMIIEAFPIIVFKKRLPDHSRRIMEIYEGLGHTDGCIEGRCIYRFVVKDNVYENGRLVRIDGKHEKAGSISPGLARHMMENGAPASLVKRWAAPDWQP